MKRFILFSLLVMLIEVGLLIGISYYFGTDFYTTLFMGSLFFVIFAFLMNSSGDALSKNAEAAVFDALLGSYKPKHQEATIRMNPVLVGSLLCFGAYFVIYYFIP